MSKIKIEWAKVTGVKADFVKGEVQITLKCSLEAGLAVRGDLVEFADTDEPVIVEIRPRQIRLPFLEDVDASTGEVKGGGERQEPLL
jgi:hypothetical protein